MGTWQPLRSLSCINGHMVDLHEILWLIVSFVAEHVVEENLLEDLIRKCVDVHRASQSRTELAGVLRIISSWRWELARIARGQVLDVRRLGAHAGSRLIIAVLHSQ